MPGLSCVRLLSDAAGNRAPIVRRVVGSVAVWFGNSAVVNNISYYEVFGYSPRCLSSFCAQFGSFGVESARAIINYKLFKWGSSEVGYVQLNVTYIHKNMYWCQNKSFCLKKTVEGSWMYGIYQQFSLYFHLFPARHCLAHLLLFAQIQQR